ncbi:unnamed protein product [Pleuronectes platessa]|uniref:Uncharacterized protein n=1 Tax=Pleuronectes platessa TaxID=8262 RepID=A0A9N7VK57_PLEPL|nr:unnamed protein product [Pleuronectes platessa]
MNHHGMLHRHAHLGACNAARLLVFLDGLHDLLVPPDQTDDPQWINHVVIRDNDRVPLLQAMEEACGHRSDPSSTFMQNLGRDVDVSRRRCLSPAALDEVKAQKRLLQWTTGPDPVMGGSAARPVPDQFQTSS